MDEFEIVKRHFEAESNYLQDKAEIGFVISFEPYFQKLSEFAVADSGASFEEIKEKATELKDLAFDNIDGKFGPKISVPTFLNIKTELDKIVLSLKKELEQED